ASPAARPRRSRSRATPATADGFLPFSTQFRHSLAATPRNETGYSSECVGAEVGLFLVRNEPETQLDPEPDEHPRVRTALRLAASAIPRFRSRRLHADARRGSK